MYCISIEILLFSCQTKSRSIHYKECGVEGLDTICNTGNVSQRKKNQYQVVLESNKSDKIYEKCIDLNINNKKTKNVQCENCQDIH